MGKTTKELEMSQSVRRGVKVFEDADLASYYVANKISELIKKRQLEGKQAILGLATGATPKGVYRELVRMHKEEGLSFANVVTFNLDEYYPMQPDDINSYVRFMHEQLFNHIDIPTHQIHIPDGTVEASAIEEHCKDYEDKIAFFGGLDLQLLGIGRTGHIGFNEPGSTIDSTTRLVTLNAITREDGIKDFNGLENVPTQALTMGVKTIVKAKEIYLMALSERKAPIVQQAINGMVSTAIPATFLQKLPHVEYVLDKQASSLL